MAKKGKLSTPAWILEGYDSPAEYSKAHGKKETEKEKGKTFKIKVCPKCGSDEVSIKLSNMDFEEESNTGKLWECKKCGWTGQNIQEKNLTEEELMEHLDKKGEEVA